MLSHMRMRGHICLLTGLGIVMLHKGVFAVSDARILTQFTLKNGDTFVGQTLAEDAHKLVIVVERLIIPRQNIQKSTNDSELITVFHKNGSVFRGKFILLADGDFFLNDRLFPAEYEIQRSEIAHVRQLEPHLNNKEQPGYAIKTGNRFVLFNRSNEFSEHTFETDFSSPQPGVVIKSGPPSWIYLNAGAAGTLSSIRSLLPGFYSLALGVNLNLKTFFPKKRDWLPDAAVEGGALYAENLSNVVAGGYIVAGPQWTYPIGERHCAFLSVQGGLDYLVIRDPFILERHTAPHAMLQIGYGYRFGEYLALVSVGVSYIYDNVTPLTGLGGSVGIGKIWAL